NGTPIVIAAPTGTICRTFLTLAQHVADAVQRERRLREWEADETARAAHQAFWERLLDE
ncbi:MAG: hypothetical protein GWN58_07905, partial [Anaerolineae bacterium]|nr:hypothetical protein [Anaerolineae bacterium]